MGSRYQSRTGIRIKQAAELLFWKFKKALAGKLGNSHYFWFYTTYFSLSTNDYQNKSVLDIGCGPRGSLEWAEMASLRVGLDPLADHYLKMGAAEHKMTYVCAGSEQIPFPDDTFDFVCSFNSIDHVAGLDETCREIRRVLKPGGLFLLIVDVHDYPTLTEPQAIPWNFIQTYFPDFEILEKCHLATLHRGHIYRNLRAGVTVSDSDKKSGILTAKLQKPI
ncbi:MAG: class I SAM-dependent methyltransferase [Bacteroidetes bacterium]|nr:class I SAM-dependent methyltransferase [Bacteroidota bacterium]